MGFRRKISDLKVSVLPDFFFDRIISVPSFKHLFRQVELKAASGGGNLRGFSQIELRGGNATNLAYALASLSVKTRLYCVGDEHTQTALANPPRNCRVKVIHGKPGYTTALEFSLNDKPVNVMISDVGDIGDFNGRRLDRNDIMGLKKSDCVALVNWSSNRKGNALASKIFGLKGRNRRLNFLDPADLAGAEGRIKVLSKEIIGRGLVDVVSLNENETRIMARALSAGRLPGNYNKQDLLRVSGRLKDVLGVTLDVHTPIGSVSSTDLGQTWVRASGKITGFVTGAGDVWDAGDIVGHLVDLPAQERLLFANASAYLYLKNRKMPALKQMTTFLVGRNRLSLKTGG
ncbi:MAG: carbohydrate kinase family protein [Candidatus Bathyarchaeia archaeon]|jgi:ribokinase